MIELFPDERALLNKASGEITGTLSKPQWTLAELLLSNELKIVSHDDIVVNCYADVQQRDGISSASLCALIRRLRERIEEVSDGMHIKTVRGWGWRFSSTGFEE